VQIWELNRTETHGKTASGFDMRYMRRMIDIMPSWRRTVSDGGIYADIESIPVLWHERLNTEREACGDGLDRASSVSPDDQWLGGRLAIDHVQRR
jgi:hypothetical protein